MDLPTPTWIFAVLASVGLLAMGVELACVAVLRRRKLKTPVAYPRFSILKPLCGHDDDLVQNLESHLRLDYPVDYEVLLGVRDEEDLAYPIARDFAAAHPDKVRLVIQDGTPGHNPKVNQLISLTRHARYEALALSDSNVQVHSGWLKEHAAELMQPGIGLSSHPFIGVGEEALGAVLDSLTIASFVNPNITAGAVAAKADQIVGKSIAIKRDVLEAIGGWHEVKDVLAEDQRLGRALRRAGLKTALCSTSVLNVQRKQPLSYFWTRHTRWGMIRFRVFMPGVLLEPLLNPLVLSVAGALFAPTSGWAWAWVGIVLFLEALFTEMSARWTRGFGFPLKHLALLPLRDLLFFLAWCRSATMGSVDWRGNRLRVLRKTRLAAPEALARVRSIHKQAGR